MFILFLQCHTVLSKCLGNMNEWTGQLLVGKESGYNMIHFTPVQELGKSNSAYCIKDQLKLNPNFQPQEGGCTLKDLGALIKKMRDEWKVMYFFNISYHTCST